MVKTNSPHTAVEAELTDGSETSLHTHAGGGGADAMQDSMIANFVRTEADFAWAGLGVSDNMRLEGGFMARVSAGATMNAGTVKTGGTLKLHTGANNGAECTMISGTNATWESGKNPHFATKLTSQAKNSAMDLQGWGFWTGGDIRDADTTASVKAMFRSEGTGELFAVTSDGSSEETTDLSSFHTLGANAAFIVRSDDDGASWDFFIDGTLRATHSTTVPGTTVGTPAGVGIQNNTTTALFIDNFDFITIRQDR